MGVGSAWKNRMKHRGEHLDFHGCLRLMRWIVDVNFACVNNSHWTTWKGRRYVGKDPASKMRGVGDQGWDSNEDLNPSHIWETLQQAIWEINPIAFPKPSRDQWSRLLFLRWWPHFWVGHAACWWTESIYKFFESECREGWRLCVCDIMIYNNSQYPMNDAMMPCFSHVPLGR